MQKRPFWAVWSGTEKFSHVGTQEAMKIPPIQLDHLHVFALESGSTQSEKGGDSRYPLLGFTTCHMGEGAFSAWGPLRRALHWCGGVFRFGTT